MWISCVYLRRWFVSLNFSSQCQRRNRKCNPCCSQFCESLWPPVSTSIRICHSSDHPSLPAIRPTIRWCQAMAWGHVPQSTIYSCMPCINFLPNWTVSNRLDRLYRWSMHAIALAIYRQSTKTYSLTPSHRVSLCSLQNYRTHSHKNHRTVQLYRQSGREHATRHECSLPSDKCRPYFYCDCLEYYY